ncbi:MAG: hypothetical protein LKH74_10525 [Levilactobacillus sp.]|uniref:hypothetical protein n=1 Tax=Levilactobacillus sp. TaxID=2767919 RepID=UPI00258D4DE8|nr:hypothetical protein [Levilactobacillus sp.]MCI1554343.1 hypothetical protein [Levilactobacillus sp.]MCI1599250.1 hypothetical protein [Levilactobacillus sp.]MCI1605752.1 hypothetical protein [Levilactobacillus sp.]
MTGKKLGRLLVGLLTLVLAFLLGSLVKPVRAEAVVEMHKPSADIVDAAGFYLSSGYTLQPQDQYTYVGHTKTLVTSFGRNMFFKPLLVHADSRQWYQSTDEGVTWTKVSGATDFSLAVTPQSAGKVYYQLDEQYNPLTIVLPPDYYSQVAAVTTVASAIKATALNVSTDDDYLYNNQSNATTTYVHGSPTPADATGDITWTSSDTSLATVDAKTGLVTANTNGQSGNVTITGSIKNSDGSTQSGTVTIKIGGGLDSQTVKSGGTAKFSVQGNFGQAPSSVVWHKVSASGTDKTVSTGNSLSYTTPATVAGDDGSKYYAVLTIKNSDGSETVTTNKAALNVIVDHTPNVTITSQMTDETDNTGNTDTTLNNVVSGDNVKITGTIQDKNVDSKLKSGTFLIMLPDNVQNTHVIIDGKNEVYAPTSVDGKMYLVVASPTDFSSVQTHTYEVDFQSIEPGNVLTKTTVQLQGYQTDEASGTPIDTYQGPDLTINETDGQLKATAAGEVTFGTLSYANINQEIEGQVEGGGNLLDVTDDRRTKGGATITLRQATPFTNSEGTHTLDATLSFVNGKLVRQLTDTNQAVLNSGNGIKVGSLGANSGQKLELDLASQAIYPGNYTSTLDWTITSAP